MSEDEKIASLKPGERWNYTSGVAAIVDYVGAECDICKKRFQYSCCVSISGASIGASGFNYTDFGKYKPSRMWYCRSHSNEEIEAKLKELDV